MKNNVIFILILLIVFLSCQTQPEQNSVSDVLKITGSYDLNKISASTEYKVLLYLPGMPLGVSSFTTTNWNKVEIKSVDNSKFKIIEFKATSLVEAIKADNSTQAYMVEFFTVNQKGIEEINNIINNCRIGLSELINIAQLYVESKREGTSNPPDPNKFSKLRTASIYNIKIQDIDGREFILQPCLENFRDSSEL